jgi:hypothetical protein
MIRSPGLRFLLAASLAIVADGHAREQARPPSEAAFTLGVLRRDGIIIPFAAWDGARWMNRWPRPGRREDIPITVAGSPKSWWLNDRPISYWTTWPLRGESQVVSVRSPINLTVECQSQVGLQTDYRSVEPPAPLRMQPYPKDGLATAGDVLVEPVAILDARAPEWSKISAEVAARIADAETKLLVANPEALPFSEAQRRKRPFALEVLFRSPGPRPGTTALYFEGIKRYGRPQDSPRRYLTAPEPLTYATGWVLLDPQAPARISETVIFSDAGREGLLYTMGLGSFRVGDKLYWAVQRSGWGFERFDIVEIEGPEVKNVFSTAGGNCR